MSFFFSSIATRRDNDKSCLSALEFYGIVNSQGHVELCGMKHCTDMS